MIFYFSSAGNSKWAAETVAAKTGDRLIYIPEAIDRGSYDYVLAPQERLGFIFPVHGWRPSIIVRRFVRRLVIKGYDPENTYSYMVVTAGDTIGRTVEIFRKDLLARGIALSSAFTLLMPESYLGLPGFNLDTPEKEEQKLAKAEKDLNEYTADILGRRRGVAITVKGPASNVASAPRFALSTTSTADRAKPPSGSITACVSAAFRATTIAPKMQFPTAKPHQAKASIISATLPTKTSQGYSIFP